MKRPVAFIVLAGVAALLASVLVYSALKKREADVQKAIASTVDIVVAARSLPLGTKIDPTAFKTARWSRESIPPGSFTDSAPLIGAFVKNALVENEPLVADKLFMGQKSAGVMPLLIPAGMRAMSVPVDEVSDIAGFVLPHAHVDVLVALSNSGGNTPKPFSKVVLQNVEVLAVAQQIEGKKDEPEVVRVVTLLVTPQDAERLTLATHEGVLRLAMRNYNDDKIVMTSGSDVESLLRSFGTMPIMAHQVSVGGRLIGTGKPQFRIEIMRDGKSRQSVSFVSEAIGPTSVRKGSPVARISPARATESDTASAEPAEAPDKAAPGNAEPTASEKTGSDRGFAPVPKTIDVP
jgi:pilus assembly protein CpaB